jgi:hypothetical protein
MGFRRRIRYFTLDEAAETVNEILPGSSGILVVTNKSAKSITPLRDSRRRFCRSNFAALARWQAARAASESWRARVGYSGSGNGMGRHGEAPRLCLKCSASFIIFRTAAAVGELIF